MASALQNVSALGNPNDRRRVNLIARYLRSTKGNSPSSADVAQAVGMWEEDKGRPPSQRRINQAYHAAKGGKFSQLLASQMTKAEGKALFAKIAKSTDPEAKNALSRIKRQVANAFSAANEYAYGEDYASRVLGSHASRYRLKDKRIKLTKTASGADFHRPKGRKFSGKGQIKKLSSRMVTSVRVGGQEDANGIVRGKRTEAPVIQRWDANRVDRRSKGKWGHQIPDNKNDDPSFGMLKWLTDKKRFARGQGVDFKERYGEYTDAKGRVRYKLASGQKPFSLMEANYKAARKAAKAANRAHIRALGKKYGPINIKKAQAARGGSKERRANAAVGLPEYAGMNPLGLRKPKTQAYSSLKNPSYDSIVPFITEYAVPVAVVGGAAGGVHFLAQKFGVTEKLTSGLEMIPVVGAPVAQYAPFTVQGLLAGGLLAVGASFVGGTAGKYLAMAAGGAIAFGGGIDVFNFLHAREAGGEGATGDLAFGDDSDLGDLAFTNTSALGDLAFTNTSALGDLAFGAANPGFKVASLSSEDYTQSSLGDALYSGPDFSGVEGQALMNGKSSYLRRFGLAPVRAAARIANRESHLAGREGHRWGWLIKMIGWERTQKLAALPPKQRLILLAKLRKAAVAAFQQSVATDLAAQAAASSQLSSGATAADVAKAHELARAEEAGFPGPASDLALPAAGQVLSGACGAGGAASANGSELAGMDYLGDPTLFMGA